MEIRVLILYLAQSHHLVVGMVRRILTEAAAVVQVVVAAERQLHKRVAQEQQGKVMLGVMETQKLIMVTAVAVAVLGLLDRPQMEQTAAQAVAVLVLR
jgi:hypothetical protein